MIEVRSSNPISGDFLQLCQFCGKSNKEVKTLIVGPMTSICNECVCISVSILIEQGQLADIEDEIARAESQPAQNPPSASSTSSAVTTVSDPADHEMGSDEHAIAKGMFAIDKMNCILSQPEKYSREELLRVSRLLAKEYEAMRKALGQEVWSAVSHGRVRDEKIASLQKELKAIKDK